MAGIKSLAKDTAIYGVSSIVGKFLNWCLTPLYTYLLVPAEYSVIVNLYAWIGVMLVLLTYGLETGFFRFANDPQKGEPQTVYSTCMTSIGVTTLLFLGIVWTFLEPITGLLQCGEHPEYVGMIAGIIALDVFASLPFAYLRYRQRPLRFAGLKLLNIGLTIALNCFFLLACPAIYERHPEWIGWFYNPTYGVGYILVSNVIASAAILLALSPEIFRIRWKFRYGLLREILHYSFPLLILGLAGMLNQNFDKIIFPHLIDDPLEAGTQLGIYGANAKIAVVMIMFTQAFRYAYEPFIFARTKGEDKRATYALVMKYFIIFEWLIFLTDRQDAMGRLFLAHRAGCHCDGQRGIRAAFRLHGMRLVGICLFLCHDVLLLAGGAKVLSRALRPEKHCPLHGACPRAVCHRHVAAHRQHRTAARLPHAAAGCLRPLRHPA